MRSSDSARVALLAALVATCSAASAPPQAAHADDPLARGFTQAHARVRAKALPAPDVPLAPLRWSEVLASHAAGVAARCRFEHSGGAYGENMGAAPMDRAPEAIVAGWA